MNRNETLLTITWKVEDIIEAVESEGFSATEENLAKIVSYRNIRNIEELSIERGWDAIHSVIRQELHAEEKTDVKRIHVVAAILIKEEDGIVKYFATQRGYGQYKDWWEFPGGKVEPGETSEEALAREIREELSAEIIVREFLTTVEYDYPEFHLSMDCYICELTSDHLDLLEHEAAKWLSVDEIDSVKWLPADIEVVERLKQQKEL